MQLDLDGVTVHVQRSGEETAPPTLWIHAFPLSGEMWRPQVESIGGRHHIVPDLPGFGASPPLASAAPLTMDGAADLLADVLDRLGVERAAVVGLSMGGYILFSLLRRHPGRVAAAILADTRAHADDDQGKQNREAFAKSVLAEGAAFAANALVPKLIAPDAAPEVRDRVEALILAASPEGIAAASRGMALRADATPGLGAIACPTLVIVGEKDGLTPPKDARAIADAVPGARLQEIAGAGHLASIERPAETSAAIEAFLARA